MFDRHYEFIQLEGYLVTSRASIMVVNVYLSALWVIIKFQHFKFQFPMAKLSKICGDSL